MPLITDLLDRVTDSTTDRPVVSRLASPGMSVGASSINLSDATNWTTTTPIHLSIYKVNAQGYKDSTTQTDWKGILSGTTVGSLAQTGGPTDQAYNAGDIVELTPTSRYAKDQYDWATEDHDVNGHHKTLTDANGNEWMEQGSVALAVNQLKVSNSASGKPVKVEANGDDTNINIVQQGKGTGLVIPAGAYPEGFLVNGKISRTVASNNMTVATKTLADNDPSADDPVFVRIGNTVHAITAALSVTKNAGTNWMNLGAAEHATQDADLFVYLGYNSTDGVVLGFSRIPYGRVYGDFSATTTNDRYAAISTITNATATDQYEVIGRFNATLSASASYNWSVPATDITINRPIFETRFLVYAAQLTGFSVNPSTIISRYQISGMRIHMEISASTGTSNATTFTISLPMIAKTLTSYNALAIVYAINNGIEGLANYASISSGASVINMSNSDSFTGWTASGAKGSILQMFYELG